MLVAVVVELLDVVLLPAGVLAVDAEGLLLVLGCRFLSATTVVKVDVVVVVKVAVSVSYNVMRKDRKQ